jgi:Tfp pilus assembly protein PilF
VDSKDKSICKSSLSPLLFFFACLLYFSACFTAYAQEQRSSEAESLYKESIIILENSDIDRAIAILKKAITADPAYPEAYDQLGYLFLKKGQIDEAITAFNAALKINPKLRTSKTGIGLALLEKNDLKNAEDVLKEALLLNPYPAMSHYALGILYERLAEYDKAIHHFKEGMRTYKSGKR